MLRTVYSSAGNYAAQGTWAGLALAASPFVRKEHATRGPATVMVRLGSAVMAEALTELLQSRGWRCWAATGAGPDVIIVDAATIGAGLGLSYPRARILFLYMEDESSREAALFCWHGAHAVIPRACGIHGLEKTLKGRRADGEEPPLPFTPQEKRVIECICRGTGSSEEIAQALRISILTVKAYVHAILGKTGAQNRLRLVSLLGDCARRESNE
jgi:DNA-binding CsgD family transcriptional regulator